MTKILQVGDPILEKKSVPVKNLRSPQTQAIIKELILICNKNRKTAGGLAAPQVGKNVCVFVVRRVDLEEKHKRDKNELSKEKLWEPMINPTIIKLGKRKTTYWEGCLSVDHGEVFGPVTRPSFVRVEYFDQDGSKRRLTAVDFFAHEIQHELDHLRGILFIKYIKNPKNLWKSKDLDEYIRSHGELPKIV